MSKSTNTADGNRNVRRQLLATVSSLALMGWALNAARAGENNTARPTIWIDLGGQFEIIDSKEQPYVPPAFIHTPSFTSITPEEIEKPLDFSFGAEGKISYQPKNSDWIFSAAIRYGRSNGHKDPHQSTTPKRLPISIGGQPNGYYFTRTHAEYIDATARKSESHEILDFQAGKDLGLGAFGQGSSSVLSLGVRIAQFRTGQNTTLGLDPNAGGYLTLYSGYIKIPTSNPHIFRAHLHAARTFHGLGPSLSWYGTLLFAGNSDSSEFTVDWGVNASLLFGRQRTSIHHDIVAYSNPSGSGPQLHKLYQTSTTPPARSRSVVVPNIGGMAGISLKFPNAKVSLGYRADFFFGAMDGGIDARHSETVGFHGPFATISMGLGG